MEKIRTILSALILIVTPAIASAQDNTADTENDVRARMSVAVDWKLRKGLHLDAGYELRTADKFTRIERNQLNVGVQYSPVKYLDLGAGYYFIGHYSASKEFRPRHRAYFDVMGSYKFGMWKLSLKERLQLTHNAYDLNRFQDTPNLLQLKTRFKVAYKGFLHLEPYAFVEMRNCFNGPSFSADYNEAKGKYTNYQFLGYTDGYVNRWRAALGLEWKINRSHGLDFRLMGDWCRDKVIDTNAEGTKLKSFYWSKEMNLSICVGYKFSF